MDKEAEVKKILATRVSEAWYADNAEEVVRLICQLFEDNPDGYVLESVEVEMCKHYDSQHKNRCSQGLSYLRGSLKCHSKRGNCEFYEPSVFEPKPDKSRLLDDEYLSRIIDTEDINLQSEMNNVNRLYRILWEATKRQDAKTASIKEQECQQRVERIFKKIKAASRRMNTNMYGVSLTRNEFEEIKEEEGL